MCELNEKLFKLVFGNIVIARNIFYYSRLYKKNEYVKFENKKELIEYKEREYISKIVYKSDEMLAKLDLPICGVLKEVIFLGDKLSRIKGNAIPHGVEVIVFSYSFRKIETTEFSKLPSSVHTVKNAIVLRNKKSFNDIPPNITSIRFSACRLNISGNNDCGDGFLTIPNTIRSLKFDMDWDNEGIELRQGDIPEGVTYLKFDGEKRMKRFGKGVIPNSIRKLQISYNNEHLFDEIFENTNIESLIIGTYPSITRECGLYKCETIKKLNINFFGSHTSIAGIKSKSLPPNIKELSIEYHNDLFEINSIPDSVTSLTLFECSIISKPNIYPPSLTNLEISCVIEYLYYNQLVKIVSLLSHTLTSLTIPRYCKAYNIEFPQTIKINYKDRK